MANKKNGHGNNASKKNQKEEEKRETQVSVQNSREEEKPNEDSIENQVDEENYVVERSIVPNLTNSTTPWLVFFSHGKRQKSQTFLDMSEDRSYVRSIPEMNRKRCLLASHGWFFMVDNETKMNDCLLLNPVTRETVSIPPLPVPYGSTSEFILSSPPSNPNYSIIYVDDSQSFKKNYIYWYGLNREWSKIRYTFDDASLHGLTLYNGRVYGMTSFGVLVVIDFEPYPIVRSLEVEVPGPNVVSYFRPWSWQCLVESCGEMFLLYIIYVTRKTDELLTIEIFKMNFSKMEWIAIDSIGDRAFFVDADGRSLSCPAREPTVKGDSIYFTSSTEHAIYRFDVADNGIELVMAFPKLSTPWEDPQWFLPLS